MFRQDSDVAKWGHLEQDSDVAKWGHHLFEHSPSYNSGYYGETVHYDPYSDYREYPINSHETKDGTVENDEIIAHTLQEEFAQLAMREAPQYSPVEEYSHIPVYEHNWHAPSTRYYNSGHNYDHEESATWCPNSVSSHGYEHDYTYPQNINNEYEHGEMDNQSYQMVPIPHVPRINGEIPSIDEATSDYERLRQRLQVYDLDEHKVQGDGNCQFRALSDQLFNTPEQHESVREEVVNQLRVHREYYEGYVPMDYDDYLCRMSQNGEWGDHVTLQAAADLYGVKISVITSFKDTCYIEILPKDQKRDEGLCLSFWAEVHYNSIHPKADLPYSNSGKKKKWWPFRAWQSLSS